MQGYEGAGLGAAMAGQPAGAAARPATVNQRPAAIIVRQGKEPGRVFEIRSDRLTIGRSRDSDVFLEDLAVSRLHATIYRGESGQYVVRDENSANGTTVNGQRIGEHLLEEGDEIGVGQTTLTFARR
jgi:pSer/pThr/pTyr-binding forkhead associated (FHA) protein